MRALLKETLTAGFVLIGLYLVLVHFTGFEGDLKAIFTGGVGAAKTLQGR